MSIERKESAIPLSKLNTLLHIIVLLAIMFIGEFLSSLPFDKIFQYVALPYKWMYGALRVSACIIVTYLIFFFYTKKILHSNMECFRIGKPYIKAEGVFYAIFLPIFVIFIFTIIGKPLFNENVTKSMAINIILVALFRALNAGILEEIIFRGYIMKLLELRWNKYIAVILPSFLFSLLHIPSMGTIHFISLLLLICAGTLVGIMFSLVAYKNNSIWVSALIHTVWNWMICGNILHIYFGNNVSDRSIVSILLSSQNPLLTGGEFGIEASIIAVIGYALIIVFTLYSMKKQNKDCKTKIQNGEKNELYR